MKIFLDTANLEEIRQAASYGVLDGITTNPTLAAKEGHSFRQLILEISEIVKEGVVNAEVVSTDTAGMLREAHELIRWAHNIVVKIPMTRDGIRALHVLHGEAVRVNVTLVFSAAQALLVAKAGATFVSPFLGRLDDIGQNGLELLREIVEMYRSCNFRTEVLAASLRHPVHVVEAAKMGADIGTMPFKVFEQLFQHPLTDRGLDAFLKDWQRAREVLGDIAGPGASPSTEQKLAQRSDDHLSIPRPAAQDAGAGNRVAQSPVSQKKAAR